SGKRIVAALLACSLIGILFYFRHSSPLDKPAFNYFKTHCRLYDRGGNLLFSFDNFYMCDFKSDGSFVASNPLTDEVVYYDKNDTVIWRSNENSHHDINFSSDENFLHTITSEIITQHGRKVRSDCFIVRNLENVIVKKWCLSEHLDELKKMGLNTEKTMDIDITNSSKFSNVGLEISHANTFNEIPENILGRYDPAFKKGNYIVNLYAPIPVAMILDSEMKHILWHETFCFDLSDKIGFIYRTHDLQVTPNGKILVYVNSIGKTVNESCFLEHPYTGRLSRLNTPSPAPAINLNILRLNEINILAKEGGRIYTTLNELDPYSGLMLWNYQTKPLFDFTTKSFGSVTLLPNNHYLFSDITKFNRAVEIDRDGKIIWERKLDKFDITLKSVKPFYNTDFFKARGIATTP
ncbi:MAG: arylsulfotransferase family protein, partial [Pseudobdellovibrio sp.]